MLEMGKILIVSSILILFIIVRSILSLLIVLVIALLIVLVLLLLIVHTSFDVILSVYDATHLMLFWVILVLVLGGSSVSIKLFWC